MDLFNMVFSGKRYECKTEDGRDVWAHELVNKEEHYFVMYPTGKQKGDKDIVHRDQLRHLKLRK